MLSASAIANGGGVVVATFQSYGADGDGPIMENNVSWFFEEMLYQEHLCAHVFASVRKFRYCRFEFVKNIARPEEKES